MSDVSCRVINSHRHYMDEIGLSFDELVRSVRAAYPDDLGLNSESLFGEKNRIPWNSFARFEREFGRIMSASGRPEWEAEYFEFLLKEKTSLIPLASTAAALAWSPAAGYRLNNMLLGPSAFGSAVVP
ncbi:MAG: hypothetical protein V4760_09195, partial [Bdellovibrionota bacterium]